MGRKYGYYFLGIGLLTYTLWLFANFYGLGFTDDSYYYVRLFPDQVSIFRPQRLFPFLISLFDNPPSGAWIINCLSLAGILLIWYRIISESSLSRTYQLTAFAFIALGVPLILVSSFIWTEPLFILITSIAFWIYLEWKKTRNLYILLMLAICLIAAVWARKIGIITGAAFIITLIQDEIKQSSRRKLVMVLWIALLTTYWLAFYKGEPIELEYVSKNFWFNLNGLANWLVPVSFYTWVRLLTLLAMLILFTQTDQHDGIGRLFTNYFILYFLIRLPVEREYIEEADRYFSILFPPAMFVFTTTMQSVGQRSKGINKLIVVLLLFLIVLNFSRNVQAAYKWHQSRKPASKVYSNFYELPTQHCVERLSLRPQS